MKYEMHPMRRYIDILREADETGMPLFFYHGTCSSRLALIKRSGLIPQYSRENKQRFGLYLTDEWDTAEYYADLACSTHDEADGDPIVFRIGSAHIDANALEPDDIELQQLIWADDPRVASYHRWQDVPWSLSLQTTHQVVYTKAIPPNTIRLVK